MYITYSETIPVGHSCFAVKFASPSRWGLPDIMGFARERRRHEMAEWTSSQSFSFSFSFKQDVEKAWPASIEE